MQLGSNGRWRPQRSSGDDLTPGTTPGGVRSASGSTEPALDRLLDRIEAGLACRAPNRGCGVIVCGLDRPQSACSALGYAAVDELRREIAHRLTTVTRANELPVQLPGGELAMVVDDLCAMRDLTTIADRMTASLRAPIRLSSGEVLRATVSIGLAAAFDRSAIAAELLDDAGRARALAEAEGGGRSIASTDRHHREAEARHRLEQDLRRAVDEDQFVVHYQPIVDLNLGRVEGFEALVRWEHPVRRLLHPGSFLDEAIELGIADVIDRFVLEASCSQALAWSKASGQSLPVSINVGARRLLAPGFADDIAAMLENRGLAPQLIQLEIPETALRAGAARIVPALRRVALTGVGLSIDNGTGDREAMEALTSAAPIARYKLDRSLFDAGPDGRADRVMRSVAAVASPTAVVAQGIEDDDHVQVARCAGVGSGQGFWIQRPALPARLASLVSEGWAGAQAPGSGYSAGAATSWDR